MPAAMAPCPCALAAFSLLALLEPSGGAPSGLRPPPSGGSVVGRPDPQPEARPTAAPTPAPTEPAIDGFRLIGAGACRAADGEEPSRCTRLRGTWEYLECAEACDGDGGCNAYMHDTRDLCITYTASTSCPKGMVRVSGTTDQPVARATGEKFWTCYGREPTTAFPTATPTSAPSAAPTPAPTPDCSSGVRFRPVSVGECPCDPVTDAACSIDNNIRTLSDCSAELGKLSAGDLCEASSPLPGVEIFSMDNCPGNFDVFALVCPFVAPEVECSDGKIKFRAVALHECPCFFDRNDHCDPRLNDTPRLPDCTISQEFLSAGDLCEADRELPDGQPGNANNCPNQNVYQLVCLPAATTTPLI